MLLSFFRCAASAGRAGAVLALAGAVTGCAGRSIGAGSPIPPSPALSIRPAAPAVGLSPNRTGSWMQPDAKSQSLLYVSDTAAHAVNVYAYPSLKLAGQLTGFAFPGGECADKAGNVWITDGGGAVYEYAHGGTSPIVTLTSGMYVPQGCAIDPKNGDLAVANGNVQVLVFQGVSHTLETFRDFNFQRTTSLGYDTHHNLFVDGMDNTTFFHYAELPAGAESFTDITLNGFPAGQEAGGVQWDGAHMAVGDSQQTIYRIQGSNVIGTTTLSALCPFAFYIDASKGSVIAPDQCGSNLVGVYPYPAGGSPTKKVTSGLNTPYGAALSR